MDLGEEFRLVKGSMLWEVHLREKGGLCFVFFHPFTLKLAEIDEMVSQ